MISHGRQLFSHTAYQPQQVFLSADTLYNNICMFWDCDKEKLDEPFAHLDSGNTHEIEKGLLAIAGKTIVNVSHVIDNENAARYDEVWHIENKSITQTRDCSD